MAQNYQQDPDEKLDYTIDYSNRLPTGDNLATSVWTVPDDLTGTTESITGRTATIWLSGGTHGLDYVIVNRSVSLAGRIVEDFITLRVWNAEE